MLRCAAASHPLGCVSVVSFKCSNEDHQPIDCAGVRVWACRDRAFHVLVVVVVVP